MDLVASYCSDSEVEELKLSSKKEIDVIQITDSDTESSEEKPDPKNEILNDKKLGSSSISCTVDCIVLDESDEDVQCSVKKKEENISDFNRKANNGIENSTEVVDYLNLDGSDSDGEQQITPNVMDELLSSASSLRSIPCGPQKPADQNDHLVEHSIENAISREAESNSDNLSVEGKVNLKSKKLHSEQITAEAVVGDAIENVSDSVNEQSRKRFKHSERDINDSNVDDIQSSDVEGSTSFIKSDIYRKDYRITHSYFDKLVCRVPSQITKTYIGHTNVVTALEWCIPQYSHLLLSASADCSLKIWDIQCKSPVQCFKNSSSLKAAKWSFDGEQVITGGYGKKAHIFDVLSGKEIFAYDVFNYVTSIQIHPETEDLFLCGTRNAILGFDLRVNSTLPIRTFFSKCEEVLDIIFLDENEFICSTNVVTRDSADRTIMAWDFSSGAILSNQIFLERYTCPSLQIHPYESVFVAQTNGDYIAAFSTNRPYKIKNRRYMGHKVSGFGVDCDISPDGKYVATGDANGDVYFYNYVNTNIVKKLTAKSNVPTNKLSWHSAFSSTIATATWDGHLQIWK